MKASPDTPHITTDSAGRMTAPSAERNIDAILAELIPRAPTAGSALEIASGTGQQVVRFAQALPGLNWQPSDIDAQRLHSIAAWAEDATNIATPIPLDISQPGWGTRIGPHHLIVTVNLLHLISSAAAETCLTEATMALAPGGLLAIYGPFLRDGRATSDGDARFHASLQAADPATGYKDVDWVTGLLTRSGLAGCEICQMPANNLMIFVRRR